MSKGLFSHIVEDSCLEEHNEYIKNKYDAVPEWTQEIKEINLDPGGMMLANGGKTAIETNDGCRFIINNEHILSAVSYYFSLEILIDASERRINDPENDEGYTVRIIKDDIVKVYQPFMILVMRADMYMELCDTMETLYMKGLNAYFDLMATLPDEYFEHTLFNPIFGDEIPEA